MTKTISITIDQEYQDALTELLESYNNSLAAPISETEYLSTVLVGCISGKVKERYSRALTELGDAASTLGYEDRCALIN